MSMGANEEDYSAYRELMMGKLSVNKGMFFENMVAQELISKNYDLVFNLFNVKEDNRLREVDFLLSRKGTMVPVEVKSAYSKRHSSLDRFMLEHRDVADRAIVIHAGNLETDNNITYLPIYMAQFL